MPKTCYRNLRIELPKKQRGMCATGRDAALESAACSHRTADVSLLVRLVSTDGGHAMIEQFGYNEIVERATLSDTPHTDRVFPALPTSPYGSIDDVIEEVAANV